MPELPLRPEAAALTASRLALAAVFVSGGRQVWQHPDGPSQAAGPFLERCRRVVPLLDRLTDVQLVRANAAVHVAAGIGLAAGRAPAICATALAGSLLPTTWAAFPYWSEPEGPQRGQLKGQFLKNLGLVGGLLAVAVDDVRRRS
ncbi:MULTISPECIES: DoxX family protein [unclassified Streptomyces]|uniref:DoxX family protein n=1 Tax=unclassified Streptomyces TaxID=2593676 RepID=UPI0022532B4F|nr:MULTISPECIES: DoxX family protein [unclassified Streptomyces]MCX4641967.1 DoxX family protein [Streptomyces sp. NBC_01446]MCX5085702.1 DoxX family protein [Streptomyces sp. NBC_00401]MCX5326841.1 DoxX family protein [Streptomyces sp. NBC_00120]